MAEGFKTCAACGELNPSSNQYCGRCGEKLIESPEIGTEPHAEGAKSSHLGAALLNLSGLGLGYLLLKRWLRWSFHFTVSILLVVTAYRSQASRSPVFWLVVFCLWLGWMALDGWRQSRKIAAGSPPTLTTRFRLIFGVAVLLLVADGLAIFGYSALGDREFLKGLAAYESGNCFLAMQSFERVTSVYELTLSSDIAEADAKFEECSLVVFAENARERREYADAIVSCETYFRLYPESPLVPALREDTAEIYHEWAVQLSESGDFQSAVDKYQALLGSYPETLMGEQARNLAAGTYVQWARQLQGKRKYAEAIQKYEIVLSQYKDTPAKSDAEELLPGACWEWAESLRRQNKLVEALTEYQMIMDRFPGTPYAADSAGVFSMYYTAATQDENSGYVCDAVPTLEAFIEVGGMYSNEAETSLPQALYDCGVEKHAQGDFSEAANLYRQVRFTSSNTELAESARVALEAVDADQRCFEFNGPKTEVGPFTSQDYTLSDTATIEIANDAKDSIEVLFCAGNPDSRSMRVGGCPSCEPYYSTPSSPRETAPSAKIQLVPGYYEVLVLCTSCPSPLTHEALHWEWYVSEGEEYSIFHYKMMQTSFPIPAFPVIPTPSWP